MTRLTRTGNALLAALLLGSTMATGCAGGMGDDELWAVPADTDGRGIDEDGSGAEFFIPDMPGGFVELPDRLIQEDGPGFGIFSVGDSLFLFGVEENKEGSDEHVLFVTSKRGGTAEVVAVLDHVPSAPAADDARIFWADAMTQNVMVFDVETRTVDVLTTVAVPPVALAVDEAVLYIGGADGRIFEAEKLGGDLREIADTAELPLDIVRFADKLYISTLSDDASTGSIFTHDLEKKVTSQVLTGYDFSAGFVVDHSNLMWADNVNRAVMSADLDGSNVEALATRQYASGNITQSRFELYISSQSDDTIKAIAKDGSRLATIAIGQAEPGEIRIIDDRLYWFNQGNGSVMYLSR